MWYFYVFFKVSSHVGAQLRRITAPCTVAAGKAENSYKFCKGWGLSAKLGKHSAIWGKLGTALQAYTLNPCTKFPPNPTSRKVNT